MSIVDEVLITQMGRPKYLLLRALIKMPLTRAEIYIDMSKIINEEDKATFQKVRLKFKEFVNKQKISGASKVETVELIQNEFKARGIDFNSAPKIVYEIWDELD